MQLALTDHKFFKILVDKVEGRNNMDRLNIVENIILKLMMNYCIKCGVDLSVSFYGLLADYTLHRSLPWVYKRAGKCFH
jgi:hypothetical protein